MNDLIKESQSFIELVGNKTAEQLGNNELIDALSLIPDISEHLGQLEETLDTALFLGLAEQIVNNFKQRLESDG